MSGFMLHGLGDCAPERHCGCLDIPAMTATEPNPTAEHTDAVARVLFMGFHDMVCPEGADCRMREPHAASYGWFDATGLAGALLTSTDPAVHAAMLHPLARAGVLTEEDAPIYRGAEHHHWQQRWDGEHTHEGRRFVTPWEVAP